MIKKTITFQISTGNVRDIPTPNGLSIRLGDNVEFVDIEFEIEKEEDSMDKAFQLLLQKMNRDYSILYWYWHYPVNGTTPVTEGRP